MYGLCWRNRHRSAPARSGLGRHVKSGSCDMPLRSSAAGSAQEAAVGRGSRWWTACVRAAQRGWWWATGGGVGSRATSFLLWPRSVGRRVFSWAMDPTGRLAARGSGGGEGGKHERAVWAAGGGEVSELAGWLVVDFVVPISDASSSSSRDAWSGMLSVEVRAAAACGSGLSRPR